MIYSDYLVFDLILFLLDLNVAVGLSCFDEDSTSLQFDVLWCYINFSLLLVVSCSHTCGVFCLCA